MAFPHLPNIVGYQTIAIDTGFTFMAPTFVGLGNGDYSIQDIKLVDFSGYGEETMQILDGDGNVIETYQWNCEDNCDDGEGWYDDNGKATRMLVNGEGFLLSNENAPEFVTFAGEVMATSYDKPISTGFTSVGNANPIEQSIQNFKLTDFSGYGEETLQILDGDGNVIETYQWNCEDNCDDGEGWYDDNGKATRMIQPGEAFLVSNENADETITIPGAL